MRQSKYMTKRLSRGLLSALLAAIASVSYSGTSTAADNSVNLSLSIGGSWQTRNDVQIPNTETGSRFSLEEAVGKGPITAARVELKWMMSERHGLRLLLAPLSYTEAVTFDESILFAGETFNQGDATDASYTFNSWRLGYFYSLMHSDVANFHLGVTLKVRDAEIRLEQGDTVSFDDDVGLVPLLYMAGDYALNDRWTVGADLDGLAGGPGRAIDLGISLDYAISKRWTIGAEVRVLDGGADTDVVYNFARFNSAALVISTGH